MRRFLFAFILLAVFSSFCSAPRSVMYLSTHFDNGLTGKREEGAFMVNAAADKILFDLGAGTVLSWVTKHEKTPNGEVYTFKNRFSHGSVSIITAGGKTFIRIKNNQDPVVDGELIVDSVSISE